MFSVFWKCLLSVSSRPYEKPQRKKRMVTRQIGYIDCRRVNSAAFVLESSRTRNERRAQNPFEIMVGPVDVQALLLYCSLLPRCSTRLGLEGREAIHVDARYARAQPCPPHGQISHLCIRDALPSYDVSVLLMTPSPSTRRLWIVTGFS